MTVIADMRTGARTALDNTASLGERHSAQPASVGSYPAGWVGDVRTDLNHDSGTRQWTAEIDVVMAVSSFDNEEEMTALDTATSELIDYVSDTPHLMGANTVVEPVRARLTSADDGQGVPRPAVTVTLGRFVFMEGR
jgi:hypothetical protein